MDKSSAMTLSEKNQKIKIKTNNSAEDSKNLGSVYLRKITSFVRREGRLTDSQARALASLYPVYGLSLDRIQQENFLREKPLILEIGFGMGDSLAQMAQEHPDWNYLGVEVHRPGVGHILLLTEKLKLNNLKIIHADVMDVLENLPEDILLQGVQIFFPDPWPKKRHHKRRLVQAAFIEKLILKIKPGGFIHLATDWEDYATWMMEVLSHTPSLKAQLKNKQGELNYAEKNTHGRPITKFQKRGENLGHGVWDMVFVKHAE